MSKELAEAIISSEPESLGDVRGVVIAVFKEVRKGGVSRIGYISGIITSDGEERIEKNLKILGEHTEKIRREMRYPVFSSNDIFIDDFDFDKLDIATLSIPEQQPARLRFWRDILESGYVTDIFMTPRWEESGGARDEHETAKRAGLTIHYL